jgi:hypothetical protein
MGGLAQLIRYGVDDVRLTSTPSASISLPPAPDIKKHKYIYKQKWYHKVATVFVVAGHVAMIVILGPAAKPLFYVTAYLSVMITSYREENPEYESPD